MMRGSVDKVVVGGDRVLLTGHLFNKVGTYPIAALAKVHGVPFYCAVPTSTIDAERRVEEVRIEERDPAEVLSIRGRRIAPRQARALNPAFDITPPEYVTAYITERGIAEKPFEDSLPRLLGLKAAKRETVSA
jgi:methylthioribose-1-phosphate isomerase